MQNPQSMHAHFRNMSLKLLVLHLHLHVNAFVQGLVEGLHFSSWQFKQIEVFFLNVNIFHLLTDFLRVG